MERTPRSPVSTTRSPSVLKVVVSIVVGVMLYLVGANVLGVLEASFLQSAHADVFVLALGGIPIQTSTVLFLATLVLMLFCLVLILERVLKQRQARCSNCALGRLEGKTYAPLDRSL